MLKKALQLAICVFVFCINSSAQWTGSSTSGDTYRDGNVGIGTNAPAAKLEINMFNPNSTPQYGLLLKTNTFFTWPNAESSFFIKAEDPGNTNATFVVNGKGCVGIGTTNLGSFKLAVEGKIGAREVQVTLTNPFPDYVFDSKYKLRSLVNLENYINQNKHLPGIPSAAEVEKNGGIELGQMNTKLLEKIEELTLYVIDLKKENEQMKEDIKKLSKKK